MLGQLDAVRPWMSAVAAGGAPQDVTDGAEQAFQAMHMAKQLGRHKQAGKASYGLEL